MPAGLPGDSAANNTGANPAAGPPIIFDALSGPKGSPLDKDPSGRASTGAMCTGIGFRCNAGNPFINIAAGTVPATAAQAIKNAGFTDDTGDGFGAANSSIVYIGGGKSNAAGVSVPYTAGFVPGNAGNGASRDAGAGPAFTCFVGKWVTAVGAVANGAGGETGFVDRCGVTLAATQSVFGSASAAQAAPA